MIPFFLSNQSESGHFPMIKKQSAVQHASEAKGRLKLLTEEIMKLPPEKLEQVENVVRAMGKRALSLREASQMVNVSVDTLRRAIKSGTLKAFRFNKGGDYRISIEELEQFITGEKR
jgi:excisionase family DNA binding protein